MCIFGLGNYGSDNTVEFQKYLQRYYPVVTVISDRIFVFMVVTKGIEIRLDPTKAQKIYFNKCIGAERVAYNAMLNTKITLYRDYGVKNFTLIGVH